MEKMPKAFVGERSDGEPHPYDLMTEDQKELSRQNEEEFNREKYLEKMEHADKRAFLVSTTLRSYDHEGRNADETLYEVLIVDIDDKDVDYESKIREYLEKKFIPEYVEKWNAVFDRPVYTNPRIEEVVLPNTDSYGGKRDAGAIVTFDVDYVDEQGNHTKKEEKLRVNFSELPGYEVKNPGTQNEKFVPEDLILGAKFRNTLEDIVRTYGGKLKDLSLDAKKRIRKDVFYGKPPEENDPKEFHDAWETVKE